MPAGPEPVRPVSLAAASPVPAIALLQMISGYWLTQMIHVAARLRIADMLAEQPLTAASIAARADCSEGGIRRLLRCLAGAGVFREGPDGSFEQSPLSELLRDRVAGSLRPLALMNGEEWHWRTWGQLERAVRSESSPFQGIFEQPIYEYLRQHPEVHDNFERAMTAFSTQSHLLALSEYELPEDVAHVVDVGGGHGTLLVHLLHQHPGLTGTLFERPETVAGAAETIARAGLEQRCRCLSGDFFERVPEGGDLYLMSMVISDWEDEDAVVLLGNCRRAMHSGSRLLVLQMVLDEPNRPSFAKELDLYCLVMTGGRERSEEEYGRLYQRAGLRLVRVHPSFSPVRVVEGVARE